MQLIMNTDCDQHGTLIKDYNREYHGGSNKYPKTLQDAYNLLKGWNTYEKTGKTYSFKIGVSFNTVGEEDREALLDDGATHPKFSRCCHKNHTVEKCTAKYRDDGTMLHNIGETKQVNYEINNEVSAEMTTNEG